MAVKQLKECIENNKLNDIMPHGGQSQHQSEGQQQIQQMQQHLMQQQQHQVQTSVHHHNQVQVSILFSLSDGFILGKAYIS